MNDGIFGCGPAVCDWIGEVADWIADGWCVTRNEVRPLLIEFRVIAAAGRIVAQNIEGFIDALVAECCFLLDPGKFHEEMMDLVRMALLGKLAMSVPDRRHVGCGRNSKGFVESLFVRHKCDAPVCEKGPLRFTQEGTSV